MILRIVLGFLLVGGWGHTRLFADESTEELKKEMQTLKERVAELEKALAQKPSSPRIWQRPPSSPSPFKDWEERRSLWEWDPLKEMNRMQEEIDQLFQDSFDRMQSSRSSQGEEFADDFELEEKEDAYVIQFDISGLNKEKINVEINEHSITISGEHSEKVEETRPHGYHRSQSYGSFLKTIPLPVDADTEHMETQQEGDLLIIRVPKMKK